MSLSELVLGVLHAGVQDDVLVASPEALSLHQVILELQKMKNIQKELILMLLGLLLSLTWY